MNQAEFVMKLDDSLVAHREVRAANMAEAIGKKESVI